jgi:hypothetical protein
MTPPPLPTLFADGRTEPFLQKAEDWVVVLSLAGALLLGAVAVWVVDRWRKKAALDEQRAGEELTSFRALYERGEITEAEYARLRAKVAERVKAKVAPPAAPAAEPPAAPGLPPSANGSPPAPPSTPPA